MPPLLCIKRNFLGRNLKYFIQVGTLEILYCWLKTLWSKVKKCQLLILKRIGLGLITLFIVSLITFVGVEVLPGDACTTYLEREAYGAALDACIKRLGLDIPAYENYNTWVVSNKVSCHKI